MYTLIYVKGGVGKTRPTRPLRPDGYLRNQPLDTTTHCGNIQPQRLGSLPNAELNPLLPRLIFPVQVNEVHAMTNQIAALKLLSQKKRTSHVLHLILSILSVGFWVPVWLLVALSNSIENARIDRRIEKLT